MVTALAYAPRVPEAARSGFRQHDIRRVIDWMKSEWNRPPGLYSEAQRNQVLLTALEQALADLHKRMGDDMSHLAMG